MILGGGICDFCNKWVAGGPLYFEKHNQEIHGLGPMSRSVADSTRLTTNDIDLQRCAAAQEIDKLRRLMTTFFDQRGMLKEPPVNAQELLDVAEFTVRVRR